MADFIEHVQADGAWLSHVIRDTFYPESAVSPQAHSPSSIQLAALVPREHVYRDQRNRLWKGGIMLHCTGGGSP